MKPRQTVASQPAATIRIETHGNLSSSQNVNQAMAETDKPSAEQTLAESSASIGIVAAGASNAADSAAGVNGAADLRNLASLTGDPVTDETDSSGSQSGHGGRGLDTNLLGGGDQSGAGESGEPPNKYDGMFAADDGGQSRESGKQTYFNGWTGEELFTTSNGYEAVPNGDGQTVYYDENGDVSVTDSDGNAVDMDTGQSQDDSIDTNDDRQSTGEPASGSNNDSGKAGGSSGSGSGGDTSGSGSGGDSSGSNSGGGSSGGSSGSGSSGGSSGSGSSGGSSGGDSSGGDSTNNAPPSGCQPGTVPECGGDEDHAPLPEDIAAQIRADLANVYRPSHDNDEITPNDTDTGSMLSGAVVTEAVDIKDKLLGGCDIGEGPTVAGGEHGHGGVPPQDGGDIDFGPDHAEPAQGTGPEERNTQHDFEPELESGQQSSSGSEESSDGSAERKVLQKGEKLPDALMRNDSGPSQDKPIDPDKLVSTQIVQHALPGVPQDTGGGFSELLAAAQNPKQFGLVPTQATVPDTAVLPRHLDGDGQPDLHAEAAELGLAPAVPIDHHDAVSVPALEHITVGHH